MAFQDLVNFSGGINTSISPMLIPHNEAIVVTSCDISNGSIVASKTPIDILATVSGAHGVYYKAQNMIVSSAEDRFYAEWGGFLYWSNSAGTIKRFDGTTTLNVGGWTKPTVNLTAVVSATEAQMIGDYTYCYTYMHSSVFESPPSAYTTVSAVSKKGVSITFTDTPPATATSRILYRVGGIVPTFRFIADIPIATTTHTDLVSDYNIDPYELVTFGNEPPPSGLDMLIENNGVFYGSVGNKVHFSRQGTPEYWWGYNYIELPNPITGLGKIGSSIVAFTESEMHVLSGDSIDNISVNKLPFQYGCINKRTVANIDGMLLWVASIAGRIVVCSFDGQGVNIISEKHRSLDMIGYLTESSYIDFTTETFASAVFTVKNAIVYNRKYYLNTNFGTYIFDFNNGLRIQMLGYTPDEYILKNATLLASLGGKLYDMQGSFSGNLNLKYKTGLITDGSSIANKSYRRVRVKGKGTYTTTVIIDGVSILTSALSSFYLPAEAVGTSIQFLLRSTGYAEILAISYEYEVLAL